jgi:DNA primase
MPGIDYRAARAEVRLVEVLELLGFAPCSRQGQHLRGACPLHGTRRRRSRSFAAQLGKNVWYCFRCNRGGNALELWAAVTHQPLHAAVCELYRRLGREVPWRSAPRRDRPGRGDTMPKP